LKYPPKERMLYPVEQLMRMRLKSATPGTQNTGGRQ
jgi:hypothetical protein